MRGISIGLMSSALALGACSALALGACGTSDSGDDSASASELGPGVTSISSGSESDTSEASASSESTATSDGPRLDLPGGEGGTAETTVGDTGAEACKKVDILFAIDTSGSMTEEQSAITGALPAFASEMIATLDTVDSLHIGVVASGPYTGNDPSSCTVDGALVAQSSCLPFAGGRRFITEQDDITTTFPCNAALGTNGPGDNTIMANIIGGVGAQQGAGECNEAFIRDDALLVIVILTDEEDDYDNPPGFNYYGSGGDPASWYADILSAKGGIETNVVVRAIVQPPDVNQCPATNNQEPLKTWFDANRIIEFTNMWTNGAVGDICDFAAYPTYLMETLAVIDSACDNFIPPG